MRFINFILILFFFTNLSAQDQYSKVFDLYSNTTDIIWSFEYYDNELYVNFGSLCGNSDCGAIGKIDYENGDTSWTRSVPWFDPGGHSMSVNDSTITYSGHEPGVYSQYFLSVFNKEGDSLTTVDLLLPDSLDNVRIGGNFEFGKHNIVYGSCSSNNTNTNVGIAFWVDEKYELDSLMVFTTGNRANTIFELDSDSSGNLVFLIETKENTPAPNSFEARRKQILRFDEKMELVDSWRASLEDRYNAQIISRMVAHSNGTIVTPSNPNASWKPQIWGIVDQEIQWRYEYPWGLDVPIPSILSMVEADNGDVIGCGWISSNQFPNEGTYGYLFRMTGTGEMIWQRAIADDRTPLVTPEFNGGLLDLVELDDGSIMAGGNQTLWYYDGDNNLRSTSDIWVVRTDAEGCILEDCEDIQDLTTSISFPVFESEVDIYPNPTADILNINISPSLGASIQGLYLYDVSGRLLKERENPEAQTAWDLSGLANGIYILRMIDENGRARSEKVVVGHHN